MFLVGLTSGLAYLQNQRRSRPPGFLPNVNLSLRAPSYCIRADSENDNGGESELGWSKVVNDDVSI